MKILFITGASHNDSMRNMNHFQRVYFLSRQAQLTVFGRKGADFTSSASPMTNVINGPLTSKVGVILFFLFWLAKIGRKNNFDIIITEPSILSFCGYIAKLTTSWKWVVDVWDIPFRNQSHSKLQLLKTKFTRKLFTHFFKITDLFMLSILPDYEFREFRVPNHKLLLMKNAIWLDYIKSETEKKQYGNFNVVCMRTTHTVDSGLDILEDAFLEFNKQCSNVTLTIVGKIPPKVAPQISRLKDTINVSFINFVPHVELMGMLNSASACVIPYKYTVDLAQIHPIKVLEYLTRGTVVIAPDLAGIRTMIRHDYNGIIFKTGDAADLAEQLSRLYRCPDLSKTITYNARQLGRENDCTWKAGVIYKALLQLVN